MEKQKVVILLDYLQGAIWTSDQETGEPFTGISIIDSDEIIRKINLEISDMFSSYYEFDTHDLPCYFDYEKQKNDKEKMLSLLNKLNNRLDEINDGSFYVEDRETERVKSL